MRDTADPMRETGRRMYKMLTVVHSKQRDAGLAKRVGVTECTRYVSIAQAESVNNEDMNLGKVLLEYTSGGESTGKLDWSVTHER